MEKSRPAVTMQNASSQSEHLIITALPPAHSRHWIPRHKKAVVEAVHAGVLPLREAMRRYDLSVEEFVHWESEFAQKRISQGSRQLAYG